MPLTWPYIFPLSEDLQLFFIYFYIFLSLSLQAAGSFRNKLESVRVIVCGLGIPAILRICLRILGIALIVLIILIALVVLVALAVLIVLVILVRIIVLRHVSYLLNQFAVVVQIYCAQPV